MPTVAIKPGIVGAGMTARRASAPTSGNKVASTVSDICDILKSVSLFPNTADLEEGTWSRLCPVGHRIAVRGCGSPKTGKFGDPVRCTFQIIHKLEITIW